jgi:hypothetical protein
MKEARPSICLTASKDAEKEPVAGLHVLLTDFELLVRVQILAEHIK